MHRLVSVVIAVTAVVGAVQTVDGKQQAGGPATAAPAAVSPTSSYLQPGTPEVGGVRHLVLIYAGQKGRVPWDAKSLLPYVAYVDRQGRPKDWFFDSFLWIEWITNDEADLSKEGKRTITKADWQWLLDAFFDRAHGVGQLEAGVREAAKSLPDKDHRVNLVITMPMPIAASTNFGAIQPGGPSLNFSRDADRVAAMKWYIRTALERWKKLDAPHVRLVGFYWLDERVQPPTREVVKQTADYLHSLGMKFYWIPFFGADGIDGWRQLGIDAAMLQPNYYTQPNVPPTRLADVARLAPRFHTGVELEVDYRAINDLDRRGRYLAYLDAGVRYGFMDHAIMGYYEGGGALRAFAASRDFLVRDLYDQTYRFVKGTYRPAKGKGVKGVSP